MTHHLLLQKTLDLYPIIETNENLGPTSTPTTTAVTDRLNASYLNYANVAFAVNQKSSVSAVYDLANPPVHALLWAGENPLGNSEMGAITNAVALAGGNTNNTWAMYVHEIIPEDKLGFGNIGGAFIKDADPGQKTSGQAYVTSHEVGHTQGLGHNTADKNDVMTPTDPATSPCRLHEFEWHMINPTDGEDKPVGPPISKDMLKHTEEP